jgi:hypothetical protein
MTRLCPALLGCLLHHFVAACVLHGVIQRYIRHNPVVRSAPFILRNAEKFNGLYAESEHPSRQGRVHFRQAASAEQPAVKLT